MLQQLLRGCRRSGLAGILAGCLAVIGSIAAIPARAAGVEARVTSLKPAECVAVDQIREEPDGKPLPKKKWRDSVWRCKAAGAWTPFLADDGDHAGLIFTRNGDYRNGVFVRLPGLSLPGDRIEWRGSLSNGRFEPKAAIFRVSRPDEDQGGKAVTTLVVIRVGEDDATTCSFAFIDLKRNGDGYALADSLADKEAPGVDCATDEPRFYSKLSQ